MSAGVPPSLWPLVQRLAAREAWPPASDAAAARLVWQAEREGLLPLLFEQHGLPGPVNRALAAHRALEHLYRRRSELLEEALADLLRRLEGEPVVLLKGADYRRRLYARPWLRPMQDIDLLVPRERMDAVCGRLLDSGLTAVPPAAAAATVASYHERVMLLGPVVVEVHHSFVQRARHRIDYQALWSRRVPVGGEVTGAFRLDDADALAYHALSLAIDEFCVPLVRYLDLWLLLESRPESLAAAVERARGWRTARALYGALRQLFRLLPESRSETRAALARRLISGPSRRFLEAAVLPGLEDHGRGKSMSRRVELWRKLWLLDNPWRRLCFGAYHAYAVVAGRWHGGRERAVTVRS
jgi:Uncharacterised nucleotidyltransferase